MHFVVLAFALAAQPLAAQQVDTSDTYRDARARELVRLARARRNLVDRSITNYQATVKERATAQLRLRMIDRLVYRRETASRIDWQRGGPINITALGAREVVPVVMPNAVVPGDLDFLPNLAFDPMDAESLFRIDTTALRHPLAPGGEAHYRHRTGDTTTIQLNERTIKLIELRIEPRRRDVRLISGSFLIDDETHSVVQIVFRLAKDFEFEFFRDGDQMNMADRDQIISARSDSSRPGRPPRKMPLPGFMKPIRAELQHVTIEYGLMHLRWWLPRLIAAEGMFQLGGVRVPLHYERSYSYERVAGDTMGALIARADIASDTATPGISRPCRPRAARGVNVVVEGDSGWAARYRKQQEERYQRIRARNDSLIAAGDTARARRIQETIDCSRMYQVTLPDSAALLTSSDLPASIYGDPQELTSAAELARLAERLKKLPLAPWQLPRANFSWGPGGNGLLRYNKVEGLSVGARGELDFGRLRADVTAHLGSADWEPKLELGLTRQALQSQTRLGLYRRLEVMDQTTGLGGFSASLNALLFGSDDRDYYRATGIELSRRPSETGTQWYDLSLFAEQQRAVPLETHFSVAHAINARNVFAPNLVAERADQAGAQLTLRALGGQNPARFRWNVELSALGSVGTFDFTRESARLQIGIPLPYRFAGALEGAFGTSTGPIPVQSLWYLGGTNLIRGYDVGEASGTAFWRARAELGTPLRAA
ncbi:MAG: hypothetical protein ACRENP_29490, partial [Longimicrobiales bacterium]